MKDINDKEIQELLTLIESRAEFRRLNNFEYRDNEGNLLSEEQINEQEWLDNVQTVLDWAGIVPVYGDAIDIINALIYFTRAGVEGKFMPNGLNGLFSCIAIIPVVGSAISIPVKTLFKAIPVGMTTKVIKELFEKGGKEAAETFTRAAKESGGEAASQLTKLQQMLTKHKRAILTGTSTLKKTFKLLAIIPFTKIDDKLAASGVRLIEKLEKFLLNVGIDTSTTVVRGVIKMKKIPTNMLTKRGRLAVPSSYGNLLRPGGRRMFYASQDMFMDYLKKEGRDVISKESQNVLFKQTLKNLDGAPMKVGESIADYAKRTGINEDKILREFTNLAIVNESKLFADFIGSANANQRAERFIKTLTDPSVVKDATGWWGQLRKSIFKVGLLNMKQKPTQDDYRREREIEKSQDRYGKSDKDREVSGKRKM